MNAAAEVIRRNEEDVPANGHLLASRLLVEEGHDVLLIGWRSWLALQCKTRSTGGKKGKKRLRTSSINMEDVASEQGQHLHLFALLIN
eukprot:1154548-Pelagomonas_calceolata.AAC.2